MANAPPHIPLAAHRFTLIVAALVWVAMIVFGAYVAASALARGGDGGAPRIGLLVAGAANVAGGVALLMATYQDWRHGVRLNRNPRAMFGFSCLAAATLSLAFLG